MCAPRGELAQSEREADRHPCFSCVRFSPPHFTIIIFYSQFPSFSSSFSSFPSHSRKFSVGKLNIFHRMNGAWHTCCIYFLFFFLHISRNAFMFFCAFPYRLTKHTHTHTSHFCHNYIHSVFSMQSRSWKNSFCLLFFFFLISPLFPGPVDPLCWLLLGESLQVLIKSLRGQSRLFLG